ncbi:MAG: hypothetical protein V4436_02465 [Patescibacteria group bacterium]
MERYIYIILCILVAVGIVIGVVYFWPSDSSLPPSTQPPVTTLPNNNPTTALPSQQNDPQAFSQASVQTTFQKEVTVNNPDNIKLSKTAVVDGYALQSWNGTNTGGEALLKYDITTHIWVVVDWGGGAWSVEGLADFGVPEAIAKKLLSNMPR